MFRLLFGTALAVALAATPALSHDTFTAGTIAISDAYSRATPPNAPVGGAYMTITNSGAEDDVLLSAATPVAASPQLHQMSMDGDVMKMDDLPEGLVIPAGQSVTLEPGGLHIMLTGLLQPLVRNETVPLTLTFAKAGTIEVTLTVAGPAAKAPEHPEGN